ncbi:hypothetical protein MKQ68_24350 [Chitinophaga horti]|uniref:Gliding motility-associated lipoprotein GldB n=1 Tax=Chitinophaga horti TaxID=2920382 RepID=A0ABY6J0M4_9BACT|nr:hypothetical protein [Chitinophaga horti]UYQ93218.1 hypothetical protein MKQ68_24350 [Chitinophaga horti]
MQIYSNKNILRLILCSFTLWTGLSACGDRVKTPDVSNIPIDVTIERFDKDFFAIDTNNAAEGLKLLRSKYPDFTPFYFQHVLNFGPYSDTDHIVQMQTRAFLKNNDFRLLQDSINQHFQSLDKLEQEITDAFRFTKYYIPSFKAPKVRTFMSAIGNYGALTVDSTVGIGLDMYLGANFPIYQVLSAELPSYLVRTFEPAYIPVNVMKVVEQDLFPRAAEGRKLVEQMIDAGRQQYFLSKVLPHTADTLRIGYTRQQLDWCDENEEMIWQFFVQRNLLYSTDWQQLMHFMGEGPSTQGMPPGSPGKIGVYTGSRIVSAYMERHPDVTLQQLMETKDALQIFNAAKYRPK